MTDDFLEQFITPYKGIILKVCRAYTNSENDLEDYYQEVCLQIWRSRERFAQQSELSTWIYRLTLNVCLTLLKKDKNRRSRFASDDLRSVSCVEVSPVSANTDLSRLYDAIRQLAEIDRAIILLYLEKRSHKEIAQIINTNPNNVGVRVHRIKQRIKEIMNHHER